MTNIICKRVLFHGQVQGVGFRYKTLRLSESFQVSGYVKNLPSGAVEVVAQGQEKEVLPFLAEIHKQMGLFIKKVEEFSLPSGKFEEFRIEK
ncbi:MAG: acylphosphatase [Deltaproteobacteria bacterium]|nr:acylphosphatase [Deltaproteobacteria bacterium]